MEWLYWLFFLPCFLFALAMQSVTKHGWNIRAALYLGLSGAVAVFLWLALPNNG